MRDAVVRALARASMEQFVMPLMRPNWPCFVACLGAIAGLLPTAPAAQATSVFPSLVFNQTSDDCTKGCGGVGTGINTVTVTQIGTDTFNIAVKLGARFQFVSGGAPTISFALPGVNELTFTSASLLSPFDSHGWSPNG